MSSEVLFEVRGASKAYGGQAAIADVSFRVRRGSIFFVVGGSGSGKSTLLRNMLGLDEPARGEVVDQRVVREPRQDLLEIRDVGREWRRRDRQ